MASQVLHVLFQQRNLSVLELALLSLLLQQSLEAICSNCSSSQNEAIPLVPSKDNGSLVGNEDNEEQEGKEEEVVAVVSD